MTEKDSTTSIESGSPESVSNPSPRPAAWSRSDRNRSANARFTNVFDLGFPATDQRGVYDFRLPGSSLTLIPQIRTSLEITRHAPDMCRATAAAHSARLATH